MRPGASGIDERSRLPRAYQQEKQDPRFRSLAVVSGSEWCRETAVPHHSNADSGMKPDNAEEHAPRAARLRAPRQTSQA